MISEGLCDTEHWSNDAENTALFLKDIKTENSILNHTTLQYFLTNTWIVTLCSCYFVSNTTNVMQFLHEIKNQVLFTSVRFKAIYMQIHLRNILKMFSSLNKQTKKCNHNWSCMHCWEHCIVQNIVPFVIKMLWMRMPLLSIATINRLKWLILKH